MRQVGRGGLNEAGTAPQGDAHLGEATQRRADAAAVSTAEIVRHPSETEQVLRILATHLRGLKGLAPSTGLHTALCWDYCVVYGMPCCH